MTMDSISSSIRSMGKGSLAILVILLVLLAGTLFCFLSGLGTRRRDRRSSLWLSCTRARCRFLARRWLWFDGAGFLQQPPRIR